MTRKSSNTAISIAMLLAFGLTGCATIGVDEHVIPAADPLAERADLTYQVKDGDQLSGIALRLTGAISNWQAIATRNGISNPRTLAVGQVLIIPSELLLDVNSLPDDSVSSTTQNLDTAKAQSLQSTAPDSKTATAVTGSDTAVNSTGTRAVSPPPVTTGHGVSVLRGLTALERNSAEDSADITLSAVNINRTFDLHPIEYPLATDPNDLRYDSTAPLIKVTGTYYPKGVYENPANYSRLIGRAAPGSLFQLDNEINDWYKIITDQGIGYIRRSDSTLVR